MIWIRGGGGGEGIGDTQKHKTRGYPKHCDRGHHLGSPNPETLGTMLLPQLKISLNVQPPKTSKGISGRVLFGHVCLVSRCPSTGNMLELTFRTCHLLCRCLQASLLRSLQMHVLNLWSNLWIRSKQHLNYKAV